MKYALVLAALLVPAVVFADNCGPEKVTNLSATQVGKLASVLTVTPTTDDCGSGTCTSWEVRRSSSPITDTNWQSATVIQTGTCSETCVTSSGLTACATYYYVAFAFDEVGNRSPLGTVVSVTQNCNGNSFFCP